MSMPTSCQAFTDDSFVTAITIPYGCFYYYFIIIIVNDFRFAGDHRKDQGTCKLRIQSKPKHII